MGPEENKEVVRRVYEGVFNELDPRVVEKYVAADVAIHGNSMPAIPQGREGIVAISGWLRTVFPDFHVSIEEMVAEDDKVMVRFGGTGTHKGVWQGIAPTGKKVELGGFEVYRLAKGKIVEFRILPDRLGMMQQMGVVPMAVR